MARVALNNENFEKVKEYVLNGDISGLNEEQKKMLERWTFAAKILHAYPVKKHALKLLKQRYPNICQSQLYADMNYADRLFNVQFEFNYDVWYTWLLNNYAELIRKARKSQDFEAWTKALGGLQKAIGDRPEVKIPSDVIEKHNFYFVSGIGENVRKFDINEVLALPNSKRTKLIDLFEKDLSIEDAQFVIES